MLQALGAALLTDEGMAIAAGGGALATLSRISIETMDPRLKHCTIEVACDVTNPLCGPTGASAVYGPQKGTTPEIVAQLDAALAHYAQIIERDLGYAVQEVAGAGAAGGMGAGLLAFLRANLRPGASLVFETVGLEQHMQRADLVLTAEGQIDEQTTYGKSVSAVATLAKRFGLPVLALAGGLGNNYQCVYALGVDAVAVLPSGPMPLAYAMEHAATLMSDAIERALRILRLGSTTH